jgi:glutamate N-acetyltransferase/amino-acid N-acetyltransferase
MKISPLAPASYPALPVIAGIGLAAGQSNIRYKHRDDLLLVGLAPGTQGAGVLTQSKVVAAPVTWCRRILKAQKEARALVVNAGNANAFTGESGMESLMRVTKAAAGALGCRPEEVLMASTGIIGEPLPDAKITGLLPKLAGRLRPDGWHDAARAIMTTDTFMKVATRKAHIGDCEITINGFAKGSGMIAPDMATLLAFVFTDAAISAPVLQELLTQANHVSFNSITVDGDTSTNDTLLAFATGQAKHLSVKSAQNKHLSAFKAALASLLTDLAIQVVRDGEGAQKLVTIEVVEAESDKAAHHIALTIANSPLVKTAIAGADANWGRIVAAAGRAGEQLVQEKVEVRIGGVLVAKDGARVRDFDETPVAAHMKGSDIRIGLNLHLAQGRAVVYTCDLTHGYIDINGSYRS